MTHLGNFWMRVDAALDRIEHERPQTFEALAEILKDQAAPGESGAHAFFSGSGGDRQLQGALHVAGWNTIWAEAPYHYVMRHPESHECITYVEGDVYPGDHRPDPPKSPSNQGI